MTHYPFVTVRYRSYWRVGTMHAIRNQKGIALAVSLVFLLLLTLLAVVSMNTGTLQQKMAGNTRDMDIAFQGSESALRYGERVLRGYQTAGGGQSAPIPNCVSGGVANIWCVGTVDWTNLGWWQSNSMTYMGDATKQITEAYEDPRVAIEMIECTDGACGIPCDSGVPVDGGRKCGYKHYRVTSRGVGVSGISESVTEAFFRLVVSEF